MTPEERQRIEAIRAGYHWTSAIDQQPDMLWLLDLVERQEAELQASLVHIGVFVGVSSDEQLAQVQRVMERQAVEP